MEQANLNKISQEILILKRQMEDMQKLVREDLEFARQTEEAWQEVDEGKCKCMSSDEFLNEVEKW